MTTVGLVLIVIIVIIIIIIKGVKIATVFKSSWSTRDYCIKDESLLFQFVI